MLLWVVSGVAGCLEESVEASCDVSFEGAECFASSFAFAEASLDVRLGFGVVVRTGSRDGVDGVVELAAAAAVEAVAGGLATRCGDWGDAGEARETRVDLTWSIDSPPSPRVQPQSTASQAHWRNNELSPSPFSRGRRRA